MANMTGTSRLNMNSLPSLTCLSAFHELPYWRSLSLQHSLHPMHIFKSVCKSLISHLVGEKEGVVARRDLELSNTKQQLWPIVDGRTCTIRVNPTSYIIPQEHQNIFIELIKNIRTPTSFGTNFNNVFTGNDKV